MVNQIKKAGTPNKQSESRISHPSEVTTPAATLPLDGMSRWSQIEPFSPFSREKFRQLVRMGKAPQPVRFSERCTAYPNRELHKFFADPLGYEARETKN